MPCYQTGSAEGDARLAVSELTKEVALLENMLCGICTRIESGNATLLALISEDPVLYNWWKSHKQQDAKERAAMEADKKRAALAKKAMKKLTKAEKEALGLR